MVQKDIILIGGGQSALATAYYLRRQKFDYLLLDAQEKAGGAWRQTWDSLHLFSPAQYSSLPGWMMPKTAGDYPTRAETLAYFEQYEERYDFPIRRGIKVERVEKKGDLFYLETNQGVFCCRALVSATGTWTKPYTPEYPGISDFQGLQIHSAHYKNAIPFQKKTVLIVGGGNSAAQILAEISEVANSVWATLDKTTFLADNVDGRYLFEYYTKLYKAQLRGEKLAPVSLANIVMVPALKEARERGILQSQRPPKRFLAKGVEWPDGRQTAIDAVIWCTGFKSAIDHLAPLNIMDSKDRIATKLTRATAIKGLWLVGYGNWTGYASATIVGVGRTARQTVKEIGEFLRID